MVKDDTEGMLYKVSEAEYERLCLKEIKGWEEFQTGIKGEYIDNVEVFVVKLI
jgi:hypothetical protein